jgi:hypothetical protein
LAPGFGLVGGVDAEIVHSLLHHRGGSPDLA